MRFHGIRWVMATITALVLVIGHSLLAEAKNVSTSAAGIVLPNYSYTNRGVVVFKDPRVLINQTFFSPGMNSGDFTIDGTTVSGLPNSAIGVFLSIDAAAEYYFSLNAPNDLALAPGGLVANFLQIGKPHPDGYLAPFGAGSVYRESNNFYFPLTLKSGVTHTIYWKLYDDTAGSGVNRFKIVCLGYIQ